MARLMQAGCETRVFDGAATSNNFPDGFIGTGTLVTADTSVFRSGSASWKFDSGGSVAVSIRVMSDATWVDGRTYYARAYFRVGVAPSTASRIFGFASSTGADPTVRLRTDGAVELMANSAVIGSPSASITDTNWHRIELKGAATATGNWGSAELVVDGTTVASGSFTVARGLSFISVTIGWISSPGSSQICNVDDLAVNDSTGTVNNGYPGDGKVVLLVPTADSAKGTGWTDDNASSASLFPSVDNTPPAGIADTTTGGGGHQIRNATANANSNYDATMTTYAAAGIGASDTINAIVPCVLTAAPVTTSAKAGTVGVVSNPAIANINLGPQGTAGAFWGGVAAGASPTGWKPSNGTITERPTVTLGTAPVMRVTQVTSSTRIAMVELMGIYVDYTPAAAPAVTKPKRYGQSYGIAHRRAALR